MCSFPSRTCQAKSALGLPGCGEGHSSRAITSSVLVSGSHTTDYALGKMPPGTRSWRREGVSIWPGPGSILRGHTAPDLADCRRLRVIGNSTDDVSQDFPLPCLARVCSGPITHLASVARDGLLATQVSSRSCLGGRGGWNCPGGFRAVSQALTCGHSDDVPAETPVTSPGCLTDFSTVET